MMRDKAGSRGEPKKGGPPGVLVSLVAGACQGGVFYAAHGQWEAFPQYVAFADCFAFMAGTAFLLAFSRGRARLFWPPVALFCLAFSLSAAWIGSMDGFGHYASGPGTLANSFVLAGGVAWFVFLPFVQALIEAGRFPLSYPALFRHAWDNFFILCEAALTVGAFWTLIWLWVSLFSLLDVDFFEAVFFSKAFTLVALPAVFGAGAALGRSREHILEALRNLAFSITAFLSPMACGIVFFFLASLVPMGLATLWETNMAAAILLWAQLTVIFFVNAALMDRTSRPYAAPLSLAVEGAALTLPVFAGLCAYALWVRIAQYGLTPLRIYALAILVPTGLYGLGYAAAVIRTRLGKGPWLGLVRPTNVVAALCLIVLALALHTPLADPLGLSARNQFRRLATGRASALTFDYAALSNDYGPEGAALFERLKSPEALGREYGMDPITQALVADGVRQVLGAKAEPPALARDRIVALSGAALPDELYAALNAMRDDFSLPPGMVLRVLAIDLNQDGRDEYLVVDDVFWKLRLFSRKADGSYGEVGYYDVSNVGPEAARESFSSDGVKAARPLFDDIEMQGKRFILTPTP